MPMTLAEAAQACGVNRSTILRALKRGAISGTRDESTGAWSVEPAELHRVFRPASTALVPVPQDAQTDALVALLREQLAEMRAQRDSWQVIAERLTSALPKPASEPEEEPKPQTWWRWLRSTA